MDGHKDILILRIFTSIDKLHAHNGKSLHVDIEGRKYTE